MSITETPPSRATAASLAILCLLVVPLLAPVAGAAAPDTRDAELTVEQPHYISDDVQRLESNDTTVYVASGEALRLYPQNFKAENVESYGVATANASLEFDQATGAFTLRPEQTGTYQVYFVVSKTVAVGGNNSTETAERRYRYDARVRVDGGLNLVHQPAGAQQETVEDAAKWREFNSTIHQQSLVGPEGTEQAVQEMISWYKLNPTNDPFSALTGGVWAYLVLGVTGTSIIVWVVVFGGHAKIVGALRKRLHTFEAAEAEEGAAKDAVAELEHRLNINEPQNMDWTEVDGFDDHIAGAFREVFGETVHDGTVEYLSAMLPRNLINDRLRIMGKEGYVAVVDEQVAADGDSEASLAERAERVHIDHRDNVATGADTIDLADASDAALASIRDAIDDWTAGPLRQFDLTDAGYDPSDLETTYESLDIDAIAERLEIDDRHFEDREAFGEYLAEFLESVEQSPICDDAGRPDDIRWVMSHFLKQAQLLEGRFNWPVMRWHREATERALQDFDPEAEAQHVVERVQGGGA